MHMVKNLENFLRDKDYYIDIYKDTLHVFNYEDLITLTSEEIKLKLKDFNLEIKGTNLIVKAMEAREILIKGKIFEVKFN